MKGGRGSKKSKTMALRTIYRMMKYDGMNVLVVRKVYGTLRDSCFTDLLWAIDRLHVQKYWRAITNPLRLIYEPKGKPPREILFRGMDDPLKITSITVRNGFLNAVWIEEAFELNDMAAFDKLVMSIRGELPPGSGLFKQITLTFNPWRENWIKERFFDVQDPNIFT